MLRGRLGFGGRGGRERLGRHRLGASRGSRLSRLASRLRGRGGPACLRLRHGGRPGRLRALLRLRLRARLRHLGARGILAGLRRSRLPASLASFFFLLPAPRGLLDAPPQFFEGVSGLLALGRCRPRLTWSGPLFLVLTAREDAPAENPEQQQNHAYDEPYQVFHGSPLTQVGRGRSSLRAGPHGISFSGQATRRLDLPLRRNP